MIVIRHIEGRRSERVAWLLEELDIPYQLDFIQGDILGSLVALEKHHEMRMTPIVEDGDVVMVESAAILEYLLHKYGKGSSLRPAPESQSFPAYLEFLHFAEGTALAKISVDITERRLTKLLTDAGGKPPPKPDIPGLASTRTGSQRVLHYANNTLAERPYFAGDAFTAADIMMHFPLKLGAPAAAGIDFTIRTIQSSDGPHWDAFPHVKRWLKSVTARPAYQRAMRTTMPAGPPSM